jgi:DNA-binding transcriptional LysR family regulator
MTQNLDTSLLRTFVAVAESGSMTAAAGALNLTQGAVSQQVKRLEEMLGCQLFARERRSLRLSADGERLFGKARRLLGLNDAIWAEMTGTTVTGRVRLGVPYDLVGTILAPVLKAYTEAWPQVDVSLVCASSPDLAKALGKGEVDLAVIEAPQGTGSGECLAIEKLVWVGARAGIAHLKRPLPVSLVTDTCAFRPLVLGALEAKGIPWRTLFENGNIEATRATVRADLAVTAWLASTVPADLDILGPDSAHPDAALPELPSFAINLHLPPRGNSPATLEFARFIRDGLLRQRNAA